MSLMDLRPLLQNNGSKIILYVWDGLGDIPSGPKMQTPLQAAKKPNVDKLAAEGVTGRLEPVSPGVTPGSGPGHLGLFGYDPVEYPIGRGALEAVGVGFDFRHGDVAARLNFCTLDASGKISDRRAGRIPSDESKLVVKKIAEAVKEVDGVEVLWAPVKEHRALMVLRGKGLGEAVEDTDPQKEGVPPLAAKAKDAGKDNVRTAKIAQKALELAMKAIRDEKKANGILARGFAKRPHWPTFEERFGLRAAVVAGTPMYRGVAKLVGMEAQEASNEIEKDVASLAAAWDKYDFFFLHYKFTDKAGEDGDFDAKVHYIEQADSAIPALLKLKPDVLIVTADHSTPTAMKGHSFHPVPTVLWSPVACRDAVDRFDEIAVIQGWIGLRPSTHLMPLALGHAGRLAKFGA
jgi:2,3-bisphosphoglycerate-independent phosphoglycerate mutase